jgi:predicted MPP superfamily phosphohydrolase
MRFALREVWATRSGKTVLLCALALPWLFWMAWRFGGRALSLLGNQSAAASLPTMVMVLAALVFVSACRLAARRLRRRAPSVPPATIDVVPEASAAPSIGRRVFAAAAASAMPTMALGGGVAGFAGKDEPVRVREVDVTIPHLPRELDGLRILHLSDLHLGCTRDADDLEEFLASLRQKPDLIALTGDIAERLEQLAPALALLSQVRATHGAFACLGNHEHFYDLDRVRRTFDTSGVQLLDDQSQRLRLGHARLAVLGVDDPFAMGHLDARIVTLAERERTADFRLLLSHRPRGFRAAAARNVDLTLSGHLHGGQVGAAKTSALDLAPRDWFPWGLYTEGQSRLYTTSGFGEWYPFRLGCPAEGALLTLRGSSST